MVPKTALKNKVQRSYLGTEPKNSSLNVNFTRKPDAIMLNADRKKANSKTVTSLLVSKSFVKIYKMVKSKTEILTRRNTFFKDISCFLFSSYYIVFDPPSVE